MRVTLLYFLMYVFVILNRSFARSVWKLLNPLGKRNGPFKVAYLFFNPALLSILVCLIAWLFCSQPISPEAEETETEKFGQNPVADAGPDVYGNTSKSAFSAETSGSITLAAKKAYDPDGGECECVWLLADTTLGKGCSTSVMLDTGRYVIVLRVTDDEKHRGTDTLNVTVSHATDTSYDFLTSLGCMNDYDLLAGDPLIYLYGGVRSVKFVYDIQSRILYYTHTKKYELHYSFCYEHLHYKKEYNLFHREQWVQGPQRRFLLGSIDYYSGSNTFALQFLSMDQLDCEDVKVVYDAIVSTSFFGASFKFFPRSMTTQTCSLLPAVSVDEIFAAQDFFPITKGVCYGRLRKVRQTVYDTVHLTREDIIVTDFLPIDLPMVAGLITSKVQSPAAHTAVLSRTRGIPNMSLRSVWDQSLVDSLEGMPVCLRIGKNTWTITMASEKDIKEYIQSMERPDTLITLACNDSTPGLMDVKVLRHADASLVGSKAANFGELCFLEDSVSVHVPEGAFAIPFYYYREHVTRNGIDSLINLVLKNDSAEKPGSLLSLIRERIVKSRLDPALLSMAADKINTLSSFKRMRFRSSSNAEDHRHFTGAGLYDSYTGEPGSKKRPIDIAIKKVWASLWSDRAYRERNLYAINHRSVSMGILVHRSFPDEDANGVVITRNTYNQDRRPGYTITVQHREYSVVRPKENYIPDILIFYTIEKDPFAFPAIEYISKSTAPGANTDGVLTDSEIILLARQAQTVHNHMRKVLFTLGSPVNYAVEIEFKIDSMKDHKRRLYVKQVRPLL